MSAPHGSQQSARQTSRQTSRQTPWWRLVAEREITTRVREKSFLIGLGITIAFVVGFFVAGSFGGGPDEYDVAVVGEQDAALVQQVEDTLTAAGEDASVSATEVSDAAAAEQAVTDGDVDAALLATDDGYELVSEDGADPGLAAATTQTVSGLALQANAEEQGVDLEALDAGTAVDQRSLDPDAEDAGTRSTIAFAFTLVFLVTALGYGMTIAQSVVQEKESRVVEILAAALPIRSLLWGKILGNTVLALGQLLVVVAVGIAGMVVTGRGDVLAGVGPAVAWYVVFFVLGFLALAALWAVAGSLSSRQEDLQSTTLPMQMLLFIPYFVSAFAGEGVKTVASMVPVASTMIMPARMAEGDVPVWQIGVALLATVAAAVLFVRIGSQVYERTLLRSGGRIGLREAMRLGAG
ncbi:ABC transporter permease [Nocardioides sp. HDW12B]|uniref:ABC transporter permease n=1 Tax=Nocardioides sp. HDW12B TaxID=2714939 RepID=UPI00140785D9|nr:ABC transporter permease [Nocardioides sp. HDW12B]QIK67261.1 ABC transporter permease [Nocardioides sp. HDW12B]